MLRLRGDYLAIVTLAFGEIIRLVLLNWSSLTGGPNGIPSIPRPSFFGLPFADAEGTFASTFGLDYSPTHRVVFLFYLILALALLTNWVTIRLRRLPIGRAWEAMREDEIACRSLGINTTTTKLTAFAIGAMFGGFAGSFFATRQGFISPESFSFSESALVLAIVVLGGMGSQLGVAIAALVMLGGFELFREFQLYRMLVFGIAMVLIMIWRPRGLVSTREPSLTSRRAQAHDRASATAPILHGRASVACASAASSPSTICRSPRERGDITALIGPNGAGKTTVFNCITGFYKPSAGLIRLEHPDGRAFLLERLLNFRVAKLARVARTFQNIRLFPGMTVLENLVVAQHNALMVASGFSFAGLLGLKTYRTAERARDRQGALLARPHRPAAARRRRSPARSPMASSAGSRSRAPCAPIRCCSASTSRRPASTPAKAPSSTRCCNSSAASTASRSC